VMVLPPIVTCAFWSAPNSICWSGLFCWVLSGVASTRIWSLPLAGMGVVWTPGLGAQAWGGDVCDGGLLDGGFVVPGFAVGGFVVGGFVVGSVVDGFGDGCVCEGGVPDGGTVDPASSLRIVPVA